MPGFNIRQSDPLHYREEIIQYWEKYLPGTGSERLDWLQANPAGASIWLMAFNDTGDEIMGMISIMLHDLYIDGTKLKTGILGDLMISEKCRVFGPALPLLKAAVEIKENNKIDFLYTVPNPASMKLTERVRFSEKIILKHLVRPVKTEPYLVNKIKNKLIAKSLSFPINLMLKIVPAVALIGCGKKFDIVESADDSFDVLFEKIRTNNAKGIISERSKEFLNWRYNTNPKFKFHFLKSVGIRSGDLGGYIVYCLSAGKLLIYDIAYSEGSVQAGLINKLLNIAAIEGCQAVYYSVSAKSLQGHKLKRHFFVDASEDVSVLMQGENENCNFNDWAMVEGDRNI